MIKFGYPCLNWSLKDRKNKTFHLKSYSEERALATIENNLLYLQEMLAFNQQHDIGFFRISSDIIPFASHPIFTVPWQNIFKDKLHEIGSYIRQHQFRISMHPSQFVLINAKDPNIVKKSVADLLWHCQLLDALGLETDAKVQIHVGGAYGDKEAAISRFITHYQSLPSLIQKRLVIENDDTIFNVADCLKIHEAVGIPIIFDNLHHECLHQGETLLEAIHQTSKTWQAQDGRPMLDYSSQERDAVKGKHAATLDKAHFTKYIQPLLGRDLDIMFEIKDKETSVLVALQIYKKLC